MQSVVVHLEKAVRVYSDTTVAMHGTTREHVAEQPSPDLWCRMESGDVTSRVHESCARTSECLWKRSRPRGRRRAARLAPDGTAPG